MVPADERTACPQRIAWALASLNVSLAGFGEAGNELRKNRSPGQIERCSEGSADAVTRDRETSLIFLRFYASLYK
jgi:hypothetical protein